MVKEALLESIRKAAADGVPPGENFTEVSANAKLMWCVDKVPHAIQALLDDPSTDVTPDSPLFWVFVRAMKEVRAAAMQL